MTTLDLEQSAPLRRRAPAPATNDDAGARPSLPPPPMGLPARHPLNLMKRTAIIGGTIYALYGEFCIFMCLAGTGLVCLIVCTRVYYY